jgi:hypothetical protein
MIGDVEKHLSSCSEIFRNEAVLDESHLMCADETGEMRFESVC